MKKRRDFKPIVKAANEWEDLSRGPLCSDDDLEKGEPYGDNINHPSHYTSHPSGVECIDIIEHFGFSVGAAIKYLWRAGLKGEALEDLRKARWFIDREIQRREKVER